MIIRPATEEDLRTVLRMAIAMHAESNRYRAHKISIPKLAALILKFHISSSKVILVAEKEACIVGMFLGYITEFFFSDDELTTDRLFYVRPEHRKGFVAYRLFKGFESWSKEVGVTTIQVGISTGIDNEGYTNFCERLGYNRTGTVLSKEI